MRKLIAFVLVLAVLLPACNTGGKIHTVTGQEMSMLKEQIAKELRAKQIGAAPQDIDYFVTYNGYHIIAVMGSTCAIHREICAGYSFEYSCGFALWAYKDGERIPLDEAYKNGLVSKDAIAVAHKAYRTQRNAVAVHHFQEKYEEEHGPVWLCRLYAAENGSPYGEEVDFLVIFVQEKDAKEVHTVKTVAGAKFEYPKEFSLFVYANPHSIIEEGNYVPLEKAYEGNFISRELIEEAAKTHAKWNKD